MKVVKKTSEYTVLQRRDGRYAVKDSKKSPVNGDEKIKILVAEGLVKVAVPAAPAPEPEAEPEAAAEEAAAEDAAPEAAEPEADKPE
jgi:hypothetical protein